MLFLSPNQAGQSTEGIVKALTKETLRRETGRKKCGHWTAGIKYASSIPE